MSVAAAERYVAAGAALLDEKGPEGWRETLYAARERLNVHSVYDCPLGILYDTGEEDTTPYQRGLNALALNSVHTGRYGFDSFYGDEDFDDDEDYAESGEVRDAWLDLIEPEDPHQDLDLAQI